MYVLFNKNIPDTSLALKAARRLAGDLYPAASRKTTKTTTYYSIGSSRAIHCVCCSVSEEARRALLGVGKLPRGGILS